MPNHCVFKDSSTTIKIRVVFEASAKTTISLMVEQRQIDGWTYISERPRQHSDWLAKVSGSSFSRHCENDLQVELEEEE